MKYVIASRSWFIFPRKDPPQLGLSRLVVEADGFELLADGVLKVYRNPPKDDPGWRIQVASFSKGQWEWIVSQEDINNSSKERGK